MTKEKDDLSLFGLCFHGEYVEIVTSLYQKNIEGDETGVIDQTLPIVLKGYILDMDDEYYYLGNTPEEISKAVKKEAVKYIEIISEQNVFDQILEDFPTPGTKEEQN